MKALRWIPALLLLPACSQDAPVAAPAPLPAAAPASQPATTPPGAAPLAPEDALTQELLAQSFGPGTVADLGLPESFVRRVRDRVLRTRYFETQRVIVPDGVSELAAAPSTSPSTAPDQQPPLEIVRAAANSARAAFLPQLAESWPPARGYRAVRSFEDPRPTVAGYQPEGPQALLVARGLAREGLLLTSARVAASLREQRLPVTLENLGRSGLPIDWLGFFRTPAPFPQWVEQRLAAGLSPEQLKPELDALPFAYQPTSKGLRLCTDSGEEALGGLRGQLSRGDPWYQPGDGGNVELLRALIAVAGELPITITLPAAQLETFQRTASTWTWPAGARLRVLTTDLPVAQWAQDNGKAARDDNGPLLLVPRFASRSELGSMLVPGETYVVEEYAAAGMRVLVSPLSFQGGNLICVRQPGTGERLLLVGEAELHRNTSLGLTREQVLGAFRAEFGVQRCVVLPAVGFHIDTEVSVRAVGDTLVAFVNDMQAGAEHIVRAGLAALQRGGRLDSQLGAQLEQLWRERKLTEFLARLEPLLEQGAPAPGQFPEALARLFREHPGDHGPGNLLTFLAALDFVTGVSGGGANPSLDPATAAYLKGFLRRELDRLSLIQGLEKLGMRIVPIPGFPEEALGIAPLNAIHTPKASFLSGHGGLYRALDEDSRARVQAACGPQIGVFSLPTAESQRRGGGVRCSFGIENRGP